MQQVYSNYSSSPLSATKKSEAEDYEQMWQMRSESNGGAVGTTFELKQLLKVDVHNLAERLLQLQNSLNFVLTLFTKRSLEVCHLVM